VKRDHAAAFQKVLLFALTGCAAYSLVIVLARFRYPYELEWMGGAMLDHVERVRSGAPLYGPPSADWTPFLYPPGYYWVVAAVSRVVPVGDAARGVALVASVVTAGLTYVLARRLGARPSLAAVAPLTFVGSYHYLSDWFELERVDMPFMAMVTGAACVLLAGTRPWHFIVSGALLGLAFFVKQPAVPFIGAIVVALFVLREHKNALLFGASAAVVLGGTYLGLQASTGGWFAFYCLTLPARHGIEAKLLAQFFIWDLGHAALHTGATLVVLVRTSRDFLAALRSGKTPDRTRYLFGALLAAGTFAAASSRMHDGGWPNVLVFWLAFAAPALASVLEELTTLEAPALEVAALALVLTQMGALSPNINELVPSRRQRQASQDLSTALLKLEEEGEVFVFGRGNLTRKRHAHLNAIIDVLRAHVGVPEDMKAAFRAQKYRAFVINIEHDIDLSYFYGSDPGLFDVVMQSYYFAEELDSDDASPVTGFTTVPRFVMFPRKTPLVGHSHAELLERRVIELALIKANLGLARAHVPRAAWFDVERVAEAKLQEAHAARPSAP